LAAVLFCSRCINLRRQLKNEASDTSRFRQNAEMESPLIPCSRITPCQNCSRSEFPHRVIPNLRVLLTWKYPKNGRRAKTVGYVALTHLAPLRESEPLC